VKPVVHGGDLGDVRRRYPNATLPWIDLSTGINPVPYPLPALSPESWTRLPSRADRDALIVAAARRYDVDPTMVVAAPGTQALIQLLPRVFAPTDVAVVGPTYEEHEVAWRREGHKVTIVDSPHGRSPTEIVVLVNPDNPTGRLIPPVELQDIRNQLIVDEAFIDFHPRAASLAGTKAIVLRSFGKTYGLAGLRLGFAIASPDIAEHLRDALGPWAVAGPAIEIGRRALADDAWLEAARQQLERDTGRLEEILTKAGLTIVGGTLLFRLVSHVDAPLIFQSLGRHGIHVRRFPLTPSWLRFGLPATEPEFDRLARALGLQVSA
jgi:cobalamin biosynthesis protein CobC